MLRKTCGTRIADGGGGVAAVASHLRHKNLQTASRYIHCSTQYDLDFANPLSALTFRRKSASFIINSLRA